MGESGSPVEDGWEAAGPVGEATELDQGPEDQVKQVSGDGTEPREPAGDAPHTSSKDSKQSR